MEPRKYDLVTVYMAFHHFPDPVGMVERIKDVLTPGGFLVIREHDMVSTWNEPDMKPWSAYWRARFLDWIHVLYQCVEHNPAPALLDTHYKSPGEWQQLLEQVGLDCGR